MGEQPKSSGPAPGFAKSPGHRVDVEPSSARVRVSVGDEIVAESANTLLMLETNHDPVYYFPRADIRMELMARTDHSSY